MKEKFDDILKRKWAQKQFPVDDNHRRQMEELLDKKDRKRFFPFWWLGTLIVVTALSGMLLYKGVDGISVPAGQDKANPAVVPQKDMATQQPVESTDPVVKNDPGEDESKKTLSTSTNDPSISQNQSSAHSASNKSNRVSSSAGNINPKPATSKTSSGSMLPSDTQQAAPQDKAMILPAKEEMSMPEESISGQHPIVESSNTHGDLTELDKAPSVRPDAEFIQRPLMEVGIVESLDMGQLLVPGRDPMKPLNPNTRHDAYFSFFGETGTGLILASKSDFSTGFKFFAGGGVGYTVHPRLQLTLSTGYLYQHGGFDFQRSSTVRQAGFGARSSFNSLSPDKLHYIYTRIGGMYRIQRHYIAMHAGFQYLYGAQGEIVTQTVDQLVPGVQENASYDWLVTDGLQRWQWRADLAYGYQLTPLLSLSAGADFYFSSLTVADPELEQQGYFWDGAYAPVHPFVSLNFLIHAIR